MNSNWIPRFATRMGAHACRMAGYFGGVVAAASLCSSAAQAQQTNQLVHQCETFQVVQASEAADLLNFPRLEAAANQSGIAQVGFHSGGQYGGECNSCGDACGGSCGGSAGFAGGSAFGGGTVRANRGSYGYGGFINENGNNACNACPTCEPYCYVLVDALMMEREDLGNFTASRNFRLNEFDYEWAPRITIGSVPDCVSGMEVTFTGVLNWESFNALAVADTMRTIFLEDPAGPAGALSAFGADGNPAADAQFQRYESTYWSIESSQTNIAWDVAKVLYGGRYISFEEEYQFGSQADAEQGLMSVSTQNQLVGFQVGLDMFTPIREFCSSYLRARAGAYLNSSETSVLVVNDGNTVAANVSDDTGFAGLIEIGAGVRYQCGEMLAIHGGVESWNLFEVATAASQLTNPITPRTGSSINSGENVSFTGFSFGAELKF